jgi:hypothetical protein
MTTDTYGRNYARRLMGKGRPVKWTDDMASLVEAIKQCRLLGKWDREVELSRAGIALFAKINGWKWAGWGPEGTFVYDTPAGPALVVHSAEPLDLSTCPGATVDELPDSWMAPGLPCYVARPARDAEVKP